MGAASSVAVKYKAELEKPADASDVAGDAEKAAAEVVRLRGLLKEALQVKQADGSTRVNCWKPAGDPVESETGGDVTTSLILLHGFIETGASFHERAKALIGDVKGLRLVAPSAPCTTAESNIAAVKALIGEAVAKHMEAQGGIHSWVDDFDFLAPGCVWDSPDSLAAVNYVHGLIRKEINRGVKAERIFVAGHSQGGILATLAAPKFSDAALGGILMCSSICPHDVGSFVDAAQKDLKVHAMHSPKDALIPYARTKAAYEPLKGGALGTFTFREQDDNLEAKMFHEPLVAGDKPGVLAFLGLGE